MQVETVSKKRILIVRVKENRLDSSLAVEFQEHIEKWSEEGCYLIILNLTEVDFIDSTILGVIVQWFKRVHGEHNDAGDSDGGNLVISNVGFKIGSLFKLTRMDRVFTIFNDESEAVQAMTGEYQ